MNESDQHSKSYNEIIDKSPKIINLITIFFIFGFISILFVFSFIIYIPSSISVKGTIETLPKSQIIISSSDNFYYSALKHKQFIDSNQKLLYLNDSTSINSKIKGIVYFNKPYSNIFYIRKKDTVLLVLPIMYETVLLINTAANPEIEVGLKISVNNRTVGKINKIDTLYNGNLCLYAKIKDYKNLPIFTEINCKIITGKKKLIKLIF